MDWDLELENSKLQDMIIIYQEEISTLEKEKKELKEEIAFLTEQLDYKSFLAPEYDET
jgi:cell division protein FtsB|tara:strand:- start:129 stop:302 length:174 start_codon:yes stop_codon:yes gene_type:complete